MAKVVFLDFDGVLNSARFMSEQPDRSLRAGLDREAVARLNRICERSGAVVVVSSSWRIGRTLVQLKEILREAGFTGKVIGATPLPAEMANEQLAKLFGEKGMKATLNEASNIIVAKGRGQEIDAWLRLTPFKVEAFAALDDDSNLEPHTDRHVRTTWAEGLLDAHVDEALALLDRPIT